MEKEILNVSECAELLGRSHYTIRLYVKNKTIPFYKKNGALYFFRTEILKWLTDGGNE